MTFNRLSKHLFLTFLLLAALVITACDDTADDPLPTVVIPTREDGGTDGTNNSDTPAETGGTSATAAPEGETPAETNATPTLAPTEEPTLTPEPTVAPVTDLPIQQVTGSPLPAISRDLLFIGDGSFKQWNQRNGQIDILIAGPEPASRVSEDPEVTEFVGDITDFVLNRDGKRAVIARRTGTITLTETALNENDVEETMEMTFPVHELLFMDLVSRDIWQIVPQIANLQSMDLSPDAQQVAFVASNLNNELSLTEEGIPPQQLFVLASGGGASPGEVRSVDSCLRSCSTPVWHIESNLVVWGDFEALKLFNIAGREAEPLLANEASMPDIAIHFPLEWANNGRFLLLNIGRIEGGNKAVFDVPTGRVIEIPDSFVYIDPFPTEVSWMPDDRLFILRTGNDTPTAELWRVNIDDGNIVKEESLLLTNANAGAMGQMHLQDGRFAFALVNEDPALSGIYHLTSLSQQPEKVNAIPAGDTDFPAELTLVLWSADGFGAIVVHNGVTYYAPADGNTLYDMSAVFGANAHSFLWQRDIIIVQ